MSFIQSMKDFAPTKTTLFWTAAGAAVLTMVIGFSYGGWKTGGSADKMASEAATAARNELAALVCVENFAAAPDAIALRDEMLAETSFRQRGFVEGQSWALMPGETSANRQVADLCARAIANLDDARLVAIEEAAMRVPAAATAAPVVDPG
ncbi:MAG: hypothetical protein H5U20_09965 [Rhodobacteraceae bacterium]|nr:hypothetical protein [Paracoccaceae bacterium]